MPIKPLQLRLLLWRWHRRIGLLAALFVVWLSLTGILLNHTERFSLSESPLPATLQRAAYGVDAHIIASFSLSDGKGAPVQLTQFDDHILQLEGQTIGRCNGKLVGVAKAAGMRLIGCHNELLLTTATGDVVERLGEFLGLPVPIEGVGECDKAVCFQAASQRYQIDIDTMDWQVSSEGGYVPSSESPLAPQVSDKLIAQYTGSSITWERFVLDIHSGRILGGWGVLLMDVMAILFAILGLSGIYMWWLRKSR